MSPHLKPILYLILFSLCGLALASNVLAADCGNATTCNCGDTVVEDYILPSDLNCPNTDGLIVGADNITIDGITILLVAAISIIKQVF